MIKMLLLKPKQLLKLPKLTKMLLTTNLLLEDVDVVVVDSVEDAEDAAVEVSVAAEVVVDVVLLEEEAEEVTNLMSNNQHNNNNNNK